MAEGSGRDDVIEGLNIKLKFCFVCHRESKCVFDLAGMKIGCICQDLALKSHYIRYLLC